MCGTGDIVFFVIFVVGFVTYRVILETMKSVLVTGASGFIGSYIVSEGIERGFQVWAGVRGSSSRRYLTDERIRFACLDLGDVAGIMWCMLRGLRSVWMWMIFIGRMLWVR